MRIAVVDDSIGDAQRIVTYLEQFQAEHDLNFQTKVFYASLDFLEEYDGDYDVIFLDIEMPGSNGLEAAREIRERDQAVGIIFVTSLAQYAIDGYEVQAIDFMVKPVGYYNFSMKLEKAFRFMESHREQDILISNKDGIVRITVSDILYMEKDRDYLLFYTRHGCSRTRGSMKEMKAKLEQMIVAADHDLKSYYLWNSCFTEAALIQEAEEAGFQVCSVYGDVAGNPCNEKSLTIAILLEKQPDCK